MEAFNRKDHPTLSWQHCPPKEFPQAVRDSALVSSSPCPTSAQFSAYLLPCSPCWHPMELCSSNISPNTASQSEKWGNDSQKPGSKYPSIISPEASCHLGTFVSALAPCFIQHWPIRDEHARKDENFQAKITKYFCILPKQNPCRKNHHIYPAYILFPTFCWLCGLLDSCPNSLWRLRDRQVSLKHFPS